MDQRVEPMPRLRRLPQLDGVRALAVGLVIAFHLSLSVDMSTHTRKLLAPVVGNDGVTLFFVLSGYLITSLLVREQVRTGRISLRNFMARRALRILPAFFVYILVAALLIAAGHLDLSWQHLVLAGVFVWDYVPATALWVGHLWSLAVEEQFYLLWPLTLLLLRTRWALRLALAVVVAGPAIRWWTAHAFPSARPRVSFMAHDRADALLAGAALAILPAALPGGYRRMTRFALRWRLDVLGALVYFVALPYIAGAGSRAFNLYFFESGIAISGALFIHGLIERPDSGLSRVLGTPVLRHLGVASYSLYLWQQPWLIPTTSLPPIVRLIGILAAAEASLWLIERPFLRLKSRLRSPGASTDANPAVATPPPAPRRSWWEAAHVFLDRRPNTGLLLGVTALALSVRLIAVVATVHSIAISPDARDYLRLAHSLASGHGWGPSFVTHGVGPEGIRPPGYPVWLAAVLKGTGGDLTTVRLVGAALGTAVAPLIAVMALQLGRSRRVAAIAGGLVAVLPSLVIASISPMSESLFVPLAAAAVVAALAFRRSGLVIHLAAAGALTGLATLVRPVGIVLAVPVIASGVVGPHGKRLVAGAAAAALGLAPVAAWEVRQIHAFHQVVPITTQGGYLVAGTYNDTSRTILPSQPGVWIPANLDPKTAALLRAHPADTEAQVSNRLSHAAYVYVSDHPKYVATTLTENTLRLLDLSAPSFEHEATENEYGVGRFAAIAEQSGALGVLLLGVAGIARGAIRRQDWAVWAVPLLLIATTVPAQSFTRFRAPVDPFLALLAAVTIAAIPVPQRAFGGLALSTPLTRRAADPQPTPHLASLTSLRFFAALMVFAVHTDVLLGGLIPHRTGYGRLVISGTAGVSFFFVLSGFVLTWSHRPAEPARQFWRRRAARILPNHVLAWAATALIYSAIGAAIMPGPALTNLLLVHAWVPILAWYNGMDTPSWSLCCEAFFYALFPVMLIWLRRTSPARARLAAAGGLLVALAAAIAAGPAASASSPAVGRWLVVDLPISRLGEFVLGIVLALELARGTLPKVRPVYGLAAVALSLGLVDLVNSPRLLVVVPVLPFALLIAAAVRSELAGGMRLLRHPIAVRLGQWSFAFYLVHWLVLVVTLRLHPRPYTGPGAIGAILLALLASTGIAGLVFQLWERPMERALRPRHDEAVVTADVPAAPIATTTR